MDCEEPTALNSNLLPVKAKGDVRLRSVLSLEKSGTTETPIWLYHYFLILLLQ